MGDKGRKDKAKKDKQRKSVALAIEKRKVEAAAQTELKKA